MDTSTTQAIAASIAAALAALVSSMVSVYFGYKATRNTSELDKRTRELEHLKAELRRTYRQLAGYHELESVAAQMIAQTTGKAPKTVQIDLRTQAETNGVEYQL
jgi:membrane protein YqaA with SNARE-associated domain